MDPPVTRGTTVAPAPMRRLHPPATGQAAGRSPAPAHAWRFGPFVLDERERRLTLGDAPIELTAKSLETLLRLVRSPGRLLLRRELLDAVWPDAVVEEGNLHWTVSAVRKALAAHDPGTLYVETVRGFGYRFVQPVSAHALVEALAPLPPGAAAVPVADHEHEARPPAPRLRQHPPRGLVPPPALRVALFALLIALGTLAVSHGGRTS